MSLTPEEKKAVEKDIRDGIRGIITQLEQIHKVCPIAISRMNPHATGTRKFLGAMNSLLETKEFFEAVLTWDIKIKEDPQ